MIANRAWAVQIFEVAFSRRICCSRVCRAKPVGRVALRVDRLSDQSTRHGAFERVARGQERGMRAAQSQRDTESLRSYRWPHRRRSRREISSSIKAKQVGGHDHHRSVVVGGAYQLVVVEHAAVGGGVLDQDTEHAVPVVDCRRLVEQYHVDPQRFGSGLNDFDRLRVAIPARREIFPWPI